MKGGTPWQEDTEDHHDHAAEGKSEGHRYCVLYFELIKSAQSVYQQLCFLFCSVCFLF